MTSTRIIAALALLAGLSAPALADDITSIGLAGATTTADAFILGRAPKAGGALNEFEGAAQDLSLYTTFINLR